MEFQWWVRDGLCFVSRGGHQAAFAATLIGSRFGASRSYQNHQTYHYYYYQSVVKWLNTKSAIHSTTLRLLTNTLPYSWPFMTKHFIVPSGGDQHIFHVHHPYPKSEATSSPHTYFFVWLWRGRILERLKPLSYHQIIWLSAQYTSFLWLALGLSYSSTKPLGRNLSYLQGFRCKRHFGIAKVPIQWA